MGKKGGHESDFLFPRMLGKNPHDLLFKILKAKIGGMSSAFVKDGVG